MLFIQKTEIDLQSIQDLIAKFVIPLELDEIPLTKIVYKGFGDQKGMWLVKVPIDKKPKLTKK